MRVTVNGTSIEAPIMGYDDEGIVIDCNGIPFHVVMPKKETKKIIRKLELEKVRIVPVYGKGEKNEKNNVS